VGLALIAGVIALGAVAGEHRSPAQQQRAGFVAGCERTAPGGFDCGCLYDRLQASGYRSVDQLNALRDRILTAVRTGDRSLLPPAFVSAALTCRGGTSGGPVSQS
jgi:hypothetical protein